MPPGASSKRSSRRSRRSSSRSSVRVAQASSSVSWRAVKLSDSVSTQAMEATRLFVSCVPDLTLRSALRTASSGNLRHMRSNLPPGPSYPSLIQGIGFWTRPLAYLEKLRAQYGKRFTLRFPFSPPFVFVTEPDQVKQVYQAPPDVLRPGEGARVLQPVVGSNSVILL